MARKSKKASKVSGKKKSGITIGALSGVQASRFIKPGVYQAKVAECEPGEGDAGDYLKWTFEVTEGKFKGMKPKPYYTTLAEGKLWNIKKVLAALNHDGAESGDEFELDPDDVIGQECVIIVDKEVYEGRRQSVIVDFGDEDDLEADEEDETDEEKEDDEDDEDEDDKDEDDEEVTEESIMEMSEDDLEELVTENDLEVDLDEFRVISKKRKAVVKAAKKAKLI